MSNFSSTNCQGKTLSGSQCQKTIGLIHGYCSAHANQATPAAAATAASSSSASTVFVSTVSAASAPSTCQGNTISGPQCKKMIGLTNGYCAAHINQAIKPAAATTQSPAAANLGSPRTPRKSSASSSTASSSTASSSSDSDSANPLCQAKTAAGKPCKVDAADGQSMCHIHLRQAERQARQTPDDTDWQSLETARRAHREAQRQEQIRQEDQQRVQLLEQEALAYKAQLDTNEQTRQLQQQIDRRNHEQAMRWQQQQVEEQARLEAQKQARLESQKQARLEAQEQARQAQLHAQEQARLMAQEQAYRVQEQARLQEQRRATTELEAWKEALVNHRSFSRTPTPEAASPSARPFARPSPTLDNGAESSRHASVSPGSVPSTPHRASGFIARSASQAQTAAPLMTIASHDAVRVANPAQRRFCGAVCKNTNGPCGNPKAGTFCHHHKDGTLHPLWSTQHACSSGSHKGAKHATHMANGRMPSTPIEVASCSLCVYCAGSVALRQITRPQSGSASRAVY